MTEYQRLFVEAVTAVARLHAGASPYASHVAEMASMCETMADYNERVHPVLEQVGDHLPPILASIMREHPEDIIE